MIVLSAMPRSIASRVCRGIASTAARRRRQAFRGLLLRRPKIGPTEDGAIGRGAASGRHRRGSGLQGLREGTRRGFRRRRPRLPGDRARPGARRAWPRRHRPDVGSLAGADRGRSGSRSRRPRSTRSSRRPCPARGPAPATRRWRCCRCWRASNRTSSSATSSRSPRRWRPSCAGVPRVTLIPHLYPVHEAGMPFFGMGMAPPRTGLGRALDGPRRCRSSRPACGSGAAELNETRARIGLPPQDALPRRHQRPPRDRRYLSAARVPAHLAAGGGRHRAARVRTAPPPDRAAVRRRAARARRQQHRPGPRLRSDPRLLRGARARAGPGGRDHERPRPGAGDRRCRPTAMLVDWLSYSQVMAASDLVVCHGGHGTSARALALGRPLLSPPRSATWPRTPSGSPGPAPG